MCTHCAALLIILNQFTTFTLSNPGLAHFWFSLDCKQFDSYCTPHFNDNTLNSLKCFQANLSVISALATDQYLLSTWPHPWIFFNILTFNDWFKKKKSHSVCGADFNKIKKGLGIQLSQINKPELTVCRTIGPLCVWFWQTLHCEDKMEIIWSPLGKNVCFFV